MSNRLRREELVALVKRLMSAEGTEQELDEIEKVVRANVSHPNISNLIYYPTVEMTAEEIVDVALKYQPLRLPAGTREDKT